MRHLVFRDILDLVEREFGTQTAESVRSRAGASDYVRLVGLLAELSSQRGEEAADLVRTVGRHLFRRFLELYPQYAESVEHPFDFLELLSTWVQDEVAKLHPEARPPGISTRREAPGVLVVVYRSSRGLADLAEGLLAGCCEHFGRRVRITREAADSRGTVARFRLEDDPGA